MTDQISICGQNPHYDIASYIFWIGFEILVIAGGVWISWLWIKGRKKFPLSERSPLLSIFFLFNVVVYLITYPMFLFAEQLRGQADSQTAKFILTPFGNSYTYIYLIKSLRLSWGYSTNREWKLVNVFNYIFGNEILLVGISVCGMVINSLTSITLSNGDYHQFDFASQTLRNDLALTSNMIENLIGLSYLLASILIVRRVDKRVNFISELYLITVFDFALGSLRNIFITQDYAMGTDLCVLNVFPLLYIINSIKLLSTLYVGMISPLKIIDPEHKYQINFIIQDLKNFVHNLSERLEEFIISCSKQKEILNKSIQQHPSFVSPQKIPSKISESNAKFLQSSQIASQSISKITGNSQNSLISSLDQESSQIEPTREDFLKKHDFEVCLIHLSLYKTYLNLTEISTVRITNELIYSKIKQFLIQISANKLQLYSMFPQQLSQLVFAWLNIDLTSDICTNSNNLEYQENEEEIVKQITESSKKKMQMIFLEYQNTYSFNTLFIQEEQLSKIYHHLLKLQLAFDQNISYRA